MQIAARSSPLMPALLWWLHGCHELPADVTELQIDVRLATGLCNTFTRNPHLRQLACLYVFDWDNAITIRPSGVSYASQVQHAELLALSVALNATLIMPSLQCACERSWSLLRACRIPRHRGHPHGPQQLRLPRACPMDNLFDLSRWVRRGVSWREHSFLRHPRVPSALVHIALRPRAAPILTVVREFKVERRVRLNLDGRGAAAHFCRALLMAKRQQTTAAAPRREGEERMEG